MRHHRAMPILSFTRITALLALLASTVRVANAIESCEVDGQIVNPANGHTLVGKTGLMRCRDGERGILIREQELRDGRFVGAVRRFQGGQLVHEYSINDRGNREGLSREYLPLPGRQTVVHEETYADGKTVGLVRSWYQNGVLGRVAFHDNKGREQAVAEFSALGQLLDLRCGPRAQLAPDADDDTWCGFGRTPAKPVTLYAPNGRIRGHARYERGELRDADTLDDNGRLLTQRQSTAASGIDREFRSNGSKRRETHWTNQQDGKGKPVRVVVLEQTFHEDGKLITEHTYRATARGGSEMVSEQRWYLNGQPRARNEYASSGNGRIRRETRYRDDGTKEFEGEWSIGPGGETRPQGIHRSTDAAGRTRHETQFEASGRAVRETEWNADGRLVRDDELFEDGSRKRAASPR